MKTLKTLNLTPHSIVLNDGTVYETSGVVARVSSSFSEIENGECRQVFGEVENLPAPEAGTRLIVSAMVFAATNRKDVVAPATGHPECRRNEKGHIVSVPCFIKK